MAEVNLTLVGTDRAYGAPLRRHYEARAGGELVATVSGSSASGWSILMTDGDTFIEEDATLVSTLKDAKNWISARLERKSPGPR